jgi:hypothetical protein
VTTGASDEMARALRHWGRTTTSAGLRATLNLAAKHIEELEAELARFREAADTLARHASRPAPGYEATTVAPAPACEETCRRSDCRDRGCLGGSP